MATFAGNRHVLAVYSVHSIPDLSHRPDIPAVGEPASGGSLKSQSRQLSEDEAPLKDVPVHTFLGPLHPTPSGGTVPFSVLSIACISAPLTRSIQPSATRVPSTS